MKMIPLKKYKTLFEAQCDKIMLEEAGIPCFLQNENIRGTHTVFAHAFAELILNVPEDCYDTAIALLKQKDELNSCSE